MPCAILYPTAAAVAVLPMSWAPDVTAADFYDGRTIASGASQTVPTRYDILAGDSDESSVP